MSWIQIWKKSKRFYSWRHVTKACDRLARRYDHQLPTRIIALARGGLVPATIIANKLGVRHVHSLGISSYEITDNGIEQPGQFKLYQPLPSNDRQIKPDDVVLIVDDISDKGSTFKFAEEYVNGVVGGNVVTLSLIIKPETSYKPDYYDEAVEQNQWIVFPWEKS